MSQIADEANRWLRGTEQGSKSLWQRDEVN